MRTFMMTLGSNNNQRFVPSNPIRRLPLIKQTNNHQSSEHSSQNQLQSSSSSSSSSSPKSPSQSIPDKLTCSGPRNGSEEKTITLSDSIKDQFRSTFKILSLRLDSKNISNFKVHPIIKPLVLASKNMRSVEADPDSKENSHKLLLLKFNDRSQIPIEALNFVDERSIDFKETKIELDYDYFTADEVLSRLLPEELDDIPSSFTIIGHIAHLNLKSEFLPYRFLIGQVILDKNLAIRTVVNKVDTIHSVYRFFEMELLAGEPNYEVTLWQGGCRFKFDFSKVYYNSRLSTEHDTLVENLTRTKPRSVIVDLCAGVGPFVMRASSKGHYSIANDLNPECIKSLKENVRLNKLDDRVVVREGDARLQIKKIVEELWFQKGLFKQIDNHRQRNLKSKKKIKSVNTSSDEGKGLIDDREEDRFGIDGKLLPDCFIVNLPESSIDFLDGFIGLFDPIKSELVREILLKKRKTKNDDGQSEFLEGENCGIEDFEGDEEGLRELFDESFRMPIVHCYCFTKELDRPEEDIIRRVSEKIKFDIGRFRDEKDEGDEKMRLGKNYKGYFFEIKFIRKVAPNKDMYRISFQVPFEVGFSWKTN